MTTLAKIFRLSCAIAMLAFSSAYFVALAVHRELPLRDAINSNGVCGYFVFIAHVTYPTGFVISLLGFWFALKTLFDLRRLKTT